MAISAPWNGTCLGLPLHFSSGNPTVCLPGLGAEEKHGLAAAEAKVGAAYHHLCSTLKEMSLS